MASNIKVPLISVLMPVYNACHFLTDSIPSILNQTYPEFEFIIINDASTDASERVILSYSDDRIKYYKNELNLGVTKTLNKGLNLCKSKYIARMDADDIADTHRLERQLYFMENNLSVGVCGSNMKGIGQLNCEFKYPEKHKEIITEMFFSNPIGHPSVIMRKSVLISNNFIYPENYRAAEDYKLWVDLSKKTEFHNIQESLIQYRIHEEQIRSVLELVQSETIDRIQKELFEEYFELNEDKDWLILKDILQLNFSNFSIQEYLLVFKKTYAICLRKGLLLHNLLLPKWNKFIIFFPNFSVSNFLKVVTLKLFSTLSFKKRIIFFIKCFINYNK